ncbi:signal peptidase II [Nisaea acidiphila]|uniref:Lipoprotein signal peptidase n=1 Tax=Nisaea acidiphila TaxID=1862145 RepID=A0A9J7AYN4_9PROT|nr:signal peptidase II [Nisaea acidiphila]UUX51898.1 signal peptidase II [Nisaea acidiphila]
MTESAKHSLKLGGVLALIVIVLDQVTKLWALSTLFLDGRVVEVTPFFNLVAVWNRGVSFGLLASDDPMTPYYLSAFAIAVVAGLAVWLSRATSPLMRISLGLIIGGALGNVIDRIRYNAVVDFIDWHIAGYHWPAFNIADSAISIGVVFLLFDSFLGDSQRSDPQISKGPGA